MIHQYIERKSSAVVTEKLIADAVINRIYSTVREQSGLLFDLVTSSRTSSLLGYLNYDHPLAKRPYRLAKLIKELEINLEECLEPPIRLNTPRKLFERQIRYWECRPMEDRLGTIVSPADSRMLLGSFAADSLLFLKEKFFDYEQLLGHDKPNWLSAFQEGDYAIFRLTPEKYHYNHFPVTGKVIDTYQIDGRYHSCNPEAVVHVVTPYSQNKRVVTVIDTDIPNGDKVGLVAMIEIVALMIGDIQQRYSPVYYHDPVPVTKGMPVLKGCPKSVYRPGSSVDVVIFQNNAVEFSRDLVLNQQRSDVQSRYCRAFQQSLVETDVQVRSAIAKRSDK
jgi:phosphatidylserine decarboxylase